MKAWPVIKRSSYPLAVDIAGSLNGRPAPILAQEQAYEKSLHAFVRSYVGAPPYIMGLREEMG
jgi:hypothetical protein